MTSRASPSTRRACGPGEGLGRPGAVQPGPPQRLVGIDVADAGDQRLVEQGALEPGATPAQRRMTTASSSNSRVEQVAGDVRDRRRHGIVRVVRAPGRAPRAARPPKVRWSTKRSCGPPSAKSTLTRRCGFGGASGGSTSSWPLMPRWATSASSGRPSGSQRYLPAARADCQRPAGQPGGQVGGAGQVPADRAGVQHPDLADRSGPTTWAARPRRTTSTSGSSGTAVTAAASAAVGSSVLSSGCRCAAARSRRPRRPAARPPSCCGRCRCRRSRRPTTALGVEDLLVVRALLGDDVLRHAERGGGGQLLQAGLPVQAGAEPGRGRQQRVDQVVHEPGRGLVVPVDR